MESWKLAFRLARFELRVARKSVLFIILITAVLASFFITSFASYLGKNYVGFDVFFIVLFSTVPIWLRPKDFQVRRVSGDFWVSPSLILFKQLPIPKQVISKCSFIVYFFYSFPFQLVLLISFYAFVPELQAMMTLGTYIAFSIIWLSFGIYVGYIMPASDVGDRITTVKMALYSIVLIVAGITFFTLFQLLFENGIVQLTIIFAQKWPLLSSLISILMAGLGFHHWQSYMLKKMDKLDYL